ncbi:cell division protein FtsL [Caloranaerobacter azorensis]|uniref:Cell division protein FtsL n=3 Tax=Caloranaerobacter azorensis TaxID=116090 RepID=A0A1M5U2H6_9FIRM|nr:cell division protein FtsL [Caloranaerobacter azorensis]KGG80562.1 hypothetical protein Y919_05510 [Caloranaerobacter azorensis H53214]QIB26698.1 hypothetical protein G3A45_04900 [Caloranaerobacter azorensis]SHH57232.1 cell division protein FtsL [Caloranaerobacter azorensis DSM 13643]
MLVAKKENRLLKNENRINRIEKREIRKSKKIVLMKVKVIMFSFLILAIALVVLLRYAHITKMRYDITMLDKRIEKLNNQKQHLIIELEKIKESKWIEKEAKQRLGLKYPTNDQTVYLTVEDLFNDETDVAEDKGDNNYIFLNAFRNVVNKMFGYFQ